MVIPASLNKLETEIVTWPKHLFDKRKLATVGHLFHFAMWGGHVEEFVLQTDAGQVISYEEALAMEADITAGRERKVHRRARPYNSKMARDDSTADYRSCALAASLLKTHILELAMGGGQVKECLALPCLA